MTSFAALSRLFGSTAPLHDAEAFSALYTETRLPVFRFIYGLHGGPVAAVEDLTHETFLRAWQTRHTFYGSPTAALGWLLTIARRLVIDQHRRHAVRGYQPSLDQHTPDPTARPEQLALQDEQRSTLLAMLQQLPDQQREMLVLRYLLHWRVDRIAAYLAINENTVSVTMRRTLQRLRRNWPHKEHSDDT